MNDLASWSLALVVNGLALYSAYTFSSYLLRRSLASASLPGLSLCIAASGIIYFAQLTLIVLFLGVVLKFLNIYSIVVTSVLVSMAIILLSNRHRQPMLAPIKQSFTRIVKSRDFFLYAIILLFIAQVAILFAKIIILPPHIWDVFTYHLTPAVEWYQQELIPAVIDTPVKRINGQALGMTVLNYWFFIFFRDDFLVELPMLLWALLLVPVSFASMRLSGVSEAWSQKFSILIFFIPIVLMQAITAKDHLGLNVGFFAALLFISVFIKSCDRKMLLLAATAFGLVLGYKLSAPIYPIITVSIFLVFIYMEQRQLLLDKTERLVLIETAAISVLIMILIGGYWYIRNLLIYDSLTGPLNFELTPAVGTFGSGFQFVVIGLLSLLAIIVYVVTKRYRGQQVKSADQGWFLADGIKRLVLTKKVAISLLLVTMIGGGWCIRNLLVYGSLLGTSRIKLPSSDWFSFQSLTNNIEDIIPRIFDYQSLYGADLAGISGFGPQFAAFGLPALLALLVCSFLTKYRTQSINLFSYSAVVLLLVYFVFYYTSNNYRLFSFFPMIMIAYGAVVLHWSGSYKNVLSAGVINIIVLVSIVWNFLIMLPPTYTNLIAFKEFVSLDVPYRTSANYTDWFSTHRPSMYKLLGDIAAGEPIAYVAHEGTTIRGQVKDDTWTYLYYGRNWERKLTYVNQRDYLECDQRYRCKVKPELKTLLTTKGISLLTVCESNVCLVINDPDFLELTPGMYYFDGKT